MFHKQNRSPRSSNTPALLPSWRQSNPLERSYCGVGVEEMVIDFKSAEKFYRWKKMPSCDEFVGNKRGKHTVINYKSDLFIFGGDNGSSMLNDLLIFDVGKKSWGRAITNGSIPAPRYHHSAVVYQGSMFIFGGYTGHTSNSSFINKNDLYEYRFSLFQWFEWTFEGRKPVARAAHGAAEYDGKLWIFAGYDGNARLNDMWVTSLQGWEKHVWEEIEQSGDIPPTCCNFALAVHNGHMYVFSGQSGLRMTNDLFQFEFSTRIWTRISTDHVVRACHSAPVKRYGHTMVVYRDCLYIYGGLDGDHFLNDIYCFDVASRRWISIELSETDVVPLGMLFHSCAVVEDAMYVFGGTVEHHVRSREMYRFQFCTLPSCTLKSDFGRLLESRQFCDLIFLVGEDEEKIEAHTAIVCARSHALKSCVLQAMKNVNNNNNQINNNNNQINNNNIQINNNKDNVTNNKNNNNAINKKSNGDDVGGGDCVSMGDDDGGRDGDDYGGDGGGVANLIKKHKAKIVIKNPNNNTIIITTTTTAAAASTTTTTTTNTNITTTNTTATTNILTANTTTKSNKNWSRVMFDGDDSENDKDNERNDNERRKDDDDGYDDEALSKLEELDVDDDGDDGGDDGGYDDDSVYEIGVEKDKVSKSSTSSLKSSKYHHHLSPKPSSSSLSTSPIPSSSALPHSLSSASPSSSTPSAFRSSSSSSSASSSLLKVKLMGLDPDPFRLVLSYIYTDEMDPSRDGETPGSISVIMRMMDVYRQALMLKLIRLEHLCLHYLKSFISLENVLNALQYAQGLHLGHVKDYCLRFTVRDSSYNFIVMSHNFENLNQSLMVDIVRLRQQANNRVSHSSHSNAFDVFKCNTLEKDLELFLQSEGSIFSDVTLMLDQSPFRSHKAILAARSSFFEALFRSFPPQGENCVNVSTADALPTTVSFQQLLNYIYTGDLSLSPEQCIYLFSASNYYGFTNNRLQAYCKYNLEMNVNQMNVIQILTAADRIGAVEMKATALDIIVNNFYKVAKQTEMSSLSHSLLLEIMRSLAERFND